MKTLKEILVDADGRRVAVGHFNISDLGAFKGITSAAQELKVPVLIGVSEGEREFLGVRTAAAIVKSYQDQYDFPIYLNADHTHSLDKVKEAAEAGFDEILFDGSALPMKENIKQTKEAVEIVRSINPAIVVEGEIGYIGSSSEIVNERPESSLRLSTPEEAVSFVKETGIDVLAPAVGNMHGMLKTMLSGDVHKRLDIGLIGEIKKACGGILMTLHGGSGTADEDFTAAVKAGIDIVHVSTELRIAWRKGLEEALHAKPDEVAPYKLVATATDNIYKVVLNRLKLFNGLS
ncbi:class II fructose-bisphosphate aldolase [Patescibacteria group bacterium]|nr:class II fructose-bisphosphate aldolase [Patescibacteria group bacterium]